MKPTRPAFANLILFIYFLYTMTGCSGSGGGFTSAETPLQQLNPPTFGGQLNRTFTSPSTTYTIVGECDPKSTLLEWTTNQQNWIKVVGACTTGGFAITVSFSRQIRVWVRAQANGSISETAVATVRLALPPSGAQLTLTSAGQADEDEGVGLQSSMLSTTVETLFNGIIALKTSLVDIIYEK